MTASRLWDDVLEELRADGVEARVLPVERLDDVAARAGTVMAEAGFAPNVIRRIEDDFAASLPDEPRPARSVVIAAVARPLTQAELTWHGGTRQIPVPPHYAGYHEVPRAIAAKVDGLLRPSGYGAAFHAPPLKTLATCAGLASYGRNNIAYVPGLGSWLQLAACVSDAPPPEEDRWGAPQALERCERCSACLRACPTQAIGADRFLLHTERCLTWHNESTAPFPGWLDPAAHHCAVGCLRCQVVCPENARVPLVRATPERFDEEETAAILAAGDAETAAGLDADAGDEARPTLSPITREKLARCGLDYAPALIARNIRALLGA